MTQCQGILHGGEHAESEQVDLDDAEVFTVILVPLDDGAAFHRSRLERHDAVERAIGNDHAAGVLAEVTRQAVDVFVEMNRMQAGAGDRRPVRLRRCVRAVRFRF